MSSSLPLGVNVTIAGHHPCGLWALNKPGGLRSHPNDARPDPQALLTVSYDAEDECYVDGDLRWFLLNRLDAPTSGLVLVADTAKVAKEVRALFAAQKVNKTYLALVRGRTAGGPQIWKDFLRVEKKGGKARVSRGGNQLSLTEVKQVQSCGTTAEPLSLLEMRPKTGRTHQLRVQCAARELPIVGDATYGDFRFNRDFASRTGFKRLFLHSAKVSLSMVLNGQKIGFRASAALPREFSQVLER